MVSGIDIFLCIFCLFFASSVIWSRSPIVSAFSLLMTFIGVAGIYFQLEAFFLSAVQVLVYAGAIAIIFVFVLMLMNLEEYKAVSAQRNYKAVLGFVLVTVLLGSLALIIDDNVDFLVANNLVDVSMIDVFKLIFEKYVVPFELATVLLLSAMIGAIFVAKRSEVKSDVV